MTEPEARKMVVGTADIAGFCKACRNRTDIEIFKMLNEYYRFAGSITSKAGGTVIKTMGDCVLVMFPVERAAEAVACLREIKSSAGKLWQQFNADCTVKIKAHVGHVAIGEMEPHGRLDAIGNAVNELFMMPADAELSEELKRVIGE